MSSDCGCKRGGDAAGELLPWPRPRVEDDVSQKGAGDAYEGLHEAGDREGHGGLVVAAPHDVDARQRPQPRWIRGPW